MTTRGCLFALILLFSTVEAGAQTGIDAQENLFGATNINATTGHGGLTAGISAEGDLTVLSWPGPSYYDQLGYRTSNDRDARATFLMGSDPATFLQAAEEALVAWRLPLGDRHDVLRVLEHPGSLGLGRCSRRPSRAALG